MRDEEKKTEAGGRPPVFARRDLMAGTGGAVLLCALGFAGKSSAAPLVRPPGTDSEGDFLARCLRCDRCLSVCPRDVITNARFSDGFLNWRTPTMSFKGADCDFCGKCAEVCPTGALKPFDKATEVIGTAALTESCIALRTSACRKCIDACPYDAIHHDEEGRPVVDEVRCNGCGTCVHICPASVFQSAQALQHAGERGILVKLPVNREKSRSVRRERRESETGKGGAA